MPAGPSMTAAAAPDQRGGPQSDDGTRDTAPTVDGLRRFEQPGSLEFEFEEHLLVLAVA